VAFENAILFDYALKLVYERPKFQNSFEDHSWSLKLDEKGKGWEKRRKG
jgi:hypothetical protein